MTDENQTDHDVELHDDENEIMEAQGHDPKNAEAQSVASVDKAGEATGSAPKRKGDQSKQDPMPKMPGTKAGMINAAFEKMNKMSRAEMSNLLGKMMAEGVDVEDDAVVETADINYEVDFSEDLNAIMADEATLSEEFKEKTSIIFEAAIKSKLAEEIDRLEEKYNEELEAEIKSSQEELVEKVDSYLNYVVEGWMEENKLAVQSGLRTEIAENFMNNLKNLFTESYIEVPESKVDLVDDLADQVEELEEKLNNTTANAIEMAEKLETYQRESVIQEASRGLADTQVEKLKSLVADIDFDNEETFASKVTTVKESYFTKKANNVTESADFESEDEDGNIVESTGSMAQYLTALKSTSKNK